MLAHSTRAQPYFNATTFQHLNILNTLSHAMAISCYFYEFLPLFHHNKTFTSQGPRDHVCKQHPAKTKCNRPNHNLSQARWSPMN